jgi:hypothetical protein
MDASSHENPHMTPAGGTGPKSRWTLEHSRFIVEVLGIIGLVVTVWLTSSSVSAARDAVQASTRQLGESQYESVYQHQLDLWRLAAENKALAPYVVGGKKPDSHVTEAEETQATKRAAITNALDFYAYVFEQLAPRDQDGSPLPNILHPGERPASVDESEWQDWVTWAATIVEGFDGAPGMCDQLNEKDTNDHYAYALAFREAVADVVRDCVK